MPEPLPVQVDEAILQEIDRHPEGLAIEELLRPLEGRISRRSLQRRLRGLVENRTVIASGAGKARRYRAREKTTLTPEGMADSEPYVPMYADESVRVRSYVRQPVSEREPVGYDRELLEKYDPNTTFYFSEEHRAHLHALGTPQEHVRAAGTYARDILDRLLIDLSWASSRLEGNTYTRLDTKNLIEFGRFAKGKDRTEAQMILNHKAAIELLVENAETVDFNLFTFLNLHASLAENLLYDPNEAGRLRARVVHIGGTVFQPLSIPQQLEHYFRMILDKARAVRDPFEQSFFVMVHIPYLQPFVDVNKRVSRLGANVALIMQNLIPLSFVDVPERAYVEGTLGVYELKKVDLLREVFMWAYERSCKRYAVIKETVADPDPIRLQYRDALMSSVQEIVRNLVEPVGPAVARLAEALVPAQDREQFIEIVLRDLDALHEGNVSRYRIRLSDYVDWLPVRDRMRAEQRR